MMMTTIRPSANSHYWRAVFLYRFAPGKNHQLQPEVVGATTKTLLLMFLKHIFGSSKTLWKENNDKLVALFKFDTVYVLLLLSLCSSRSLYVEYGVWGRLCYDIGGENFWLMPMMRNFTTGAWCEWRRHSGFRFSGVSSAKGILLNSR